MSSTVYCVNCGVQSYVDGVQTHIMGCPSLGKSTLRKPTEMEMRCAMKLCCGREIDEMCKRGAVNCDAMDYLRDVRTVIREMRNPTGEMVHGAITIIEERPDEKLSWHLDVHRAVIDAASPEIKS